MAQGGLWLGQNTFHGLCRILGTLHRQIDAAGKHRVYECIGITDKKEAIPGHFS